MGLGPVTKEVGGRKFSLTLLPTSRCNDVMGMLAEMVGPALLEASGKGEVGFVGAIVNAVRGPKLNELAAALLFACQCDGVTLFQTGSPSASAAQGYDEVFTGRIHELYVVLGWAIEKNFGGFIGLLSGLMPTVMARAEEVGKLRAAMSPKASSTSATTGPSGASSSAALHQA